MVEKLRVVATPIGNLDDLAPRAAAALKTAAVVLAEDTRHSKPLLDRIGAHAKLVSCHQHVEQERVDLVVERLAAGDAVALISDAGAPSISDPGGRLVEGVVARGFEVEVFPGPSALVAALMGAGVDATRFSFLGFLPKRGGARAALIEAAVATGFALVVYEAPGRVEDTLADLRAACGPRRVVVARELTKRFETFHRGALGGPLLPPLVDKGEAVIVVEGGEARPIGRIDVGDAAAVRAAVDLARADEAVKPKERAKALAKQLGVSTKEAYALIAQEASLAIRGAPSLATAPSQPRPPAARERTSGGATPTAGERRAARKAAVAACRPLIDEALRKVAEAAQLLVDADARAADAMGAPARAAAVAPAVTSDIPGTEALLAWGAHPPALPAPIEAQDAGKQLLTALASLDLLADALGFVDES